MSSFHHFSLPEVILKTKLWLFMGATSCGKWDPLSAVSKQQKNKSDIKMISSYSITHLPWGLFVPLFICSYNWLCGTFNSVTIVIECQLSVQVYGWLMTLRYILWSVNQFSWQCKRACDAFQVHSSGDWIAICVFIFGSLAVIWLLLNTIDRRHTENIPCNKDKNVCIYLDGASLHSPVKCGLSGRSSWHI